jgi:hypothetical protein
MGNLRRRELKFWPNRVNALSPWSDAGIAEVLLRLE